MPPPTRRARPGLYGHSHPVILAAIREALDGGIVFGGPNRYEADLARLLCERFPSLDLAPFTNSGTEANLVALATARAPTGRERVLAFQGDYHGGVLSFASGVGSPINAPFAYDGFVGGGRGHEGVLRGLGG